LGLPFNRYDRSTFYGFEGTDTQITPHMKGVKQMRCESLNFDQTQLMSEKTKKDTGQTSGSGFWRHWLHWSICHRRLSTPITVARDAEAPGDNRFSKRGSHAPTST